MKKLQLKLDGVKEMLTKEQMKKIIGGTGSAGGSGSGLTSCAGSCPTGQTASITDCIGNCTGYTGYAECVGAHNTLKKTCA